MTSPASGDLYKKEFFQSETFQKWHSQYTGSKDAKGFAGLVRDLLNRMKKEPDQEKVREILLSAVYFKADTANDLTLFLRASGTALDGDALSESKKLMKEYADTFFALTTIKKEVAFLKAEEVVELKGFCAEKLVWSVVNVIFYNPKTGLLDSAMVPSSLTCLPALITFITQHPDPKVSRYYSLAAENFLQLVHGIDGVDYKRGTVEVRARRSEVLKVLNYLFSTKASTYKDFGDMLSYDEKGTLFLQEPHDTDDYGQVELKRSHSDLSDVISGELNFRAGHGFFVFDKQGQNSMYQNISAIEKLDDAVNSCGVLVRLVPGWLHRLIKWGKNPGDSSISAVEGILTNNKVTKVELNELSQGLAEKKCTLLHTAIEQNRADLVCCFLEQGINPNVVDSNGDSPLWLAIQNKSKLMVQALVSAGAQVNIVDQNGESYLHKAISMKDVKMVRLCLEAKIDFTLRTTNGESALYYAVKINDRPIIKELLKAGASYQDTDGLDKSPLALGMFEEGFCIDVDLIKLLWDAPGIFSENHKAQVFLEAIKRKKKMVDTDYAIILNLMLTEGVDITIPDVSGKTALGYAFRSGDLALVATLLSKRMFK